MSNKQVYIETIGCQMNVYDSEQMARLLHPLGYVRTGEPENADLIIANTCAIRGKAEQKAVSFLGRLAALKKQKPDLIVGVAGCVAQQEGRRLLKRMPHLDLVLGTRAINRLPELVERIRTEKCRVAEVDLDLPATEIRPDAPNPEDLGVASFVTIMHGCDNFCTYCVVPYVRGREQSRRPEAILAEIRRLVAGGVREVTLLGQNVNSYGTKEGFPSFAQLLAAIHEIDGIERIRFTTSHPKDLSCELMEAVSRLEKVCNHIHLPVQSGSDRILKRMNRHYTRQRYLEKIEELRAAVYGIALTTDIIVGFPGETDADFQATLDLIQKADYDNLFAFAYSDRPNAPAGKFSGKVTESAKKQRLQAVLKSQETRTLAKNQELVDQTCEILVEGLSKNLHAIAPMERDRHMAQWTGRTQTNKIVNFVQHPTVCGTPETIAAGALVMVRIEKAFSHSLWGRTVLTPDVTRRKGESHAA